MKILQLCKKFPFPLNDGESIAVTFLAQAMKTCGAKLTLLSMNTRKHFFDLDTLPASFSHYEAIHTIEIDNRLKPVDAFCNLFSKDSYHISRFISLEFEKKLIDLLEKEHFDVVQLESLFMAPYIPAIRKYSRALVVMRAHNVEHEIWDRIAQQESGFLKKEYIAYLTAKLKRYELEMLAHYDLLVPITHRDELLFRALGYSGTSITIPVGLDMNKYQPNMDKFPSIKAISFIGSLDWMPNIEGLKWFLLEVWPFVQEELPEALFFIAGRNAPAWLSNYHNKGVQFVGEVPDAADFIEKYPVTVVPLLSGSGIRVKIVENMAMGRAIVTTTVGLEGIPATHNLEVLIADDPKPMATCIVDLLKVPDRSKMMGIASRAFVQKKFDNRLLATQLFEKMEECVQKKVHQRTTD